MTVEQAASIVQMLQEVYSKTLSNGTIAMYITSIEDLPYEAGKAAALNHISASKWFPTVAEIRQAAFDLLPQTRIPTPEEAWGEVVKQMERCGIYKAPKFSHPAIVQAVHALNWRELCSSAFPASDRNAFFRIYESYRNRAIQDALQVPAVKELTKTLAEKLDMQKAHKVVPIVNALANQLSLDCGKGA